MVKLKKPVRKAQQQAPVAEPVSFLCEVDTNFLEDWIDEVFDPNEWHKNADQPYVRVDPTWNDWVGLTDDIVNQVMKKFPECKSANRALSVVHPGDYVPLHTDNVAPNGVTRVHVPLVTNLGAVYISGGKDYQLGVGMAYTVDVSVPHAIRNSGKKSRIHLMFDVVK